MLVSKLEISDVTGMDRTSDDSSSSSSAPESKKEDGKEKTIDDNEIEGDITVTIIIIKKPTKPEF